MAARTTGVAAGNLQRAGYISSRRGHIAVLRRSGLEVTTCACYAVVKQAMQSLFADERYLTNPAEATSAARHSYPHIHGARAHA